MELKYTLMPYVYAQAKESSAQGWPMLRTLFFEFPDDPTAWTIDDEYMFGSDLLVAPLFEDGPGRRLYLPPGRWTDYQTGQRYEGARWQTIAANPIPIVLLVRDHAVIPRVAVAQSTSQIDWKDIELLVYSSDGRPASGLFALPEGPLRALRLSAKEGRFTLDLDPLAGTVKYRIEPR